MGLDDNPKLKRNPKELYNFLLVAGIIFASFNLRPAITSVGPLVGIIRDDLGLANWSVGFLVSLPLLAFAVMSSLVPKIGIRYTNEGALLIGLVVVFFGMLMRTAPSVSLLFLGTLIIGLGIAICNVLIPAIVKEKFPLKVALMTGIYSVSMGTFAAVASGFSIPFAVGLDLGWRLSLFVWVIPLVIGIAIWIYLANKRRADTGTREVRRLSAVKDKGNQIFRSPLAWQMAIFMGLQSFLFYVTISWLPEILHDMGFKIGTAGWMLSYSQFVGLPSSFIIPMIAGKFKSQQGIVVMLGLGNILGLSGLLLGNSFLITAVSITLIGVCSNGTFALALTFLGLRTRSGGDAAKLSGMSQALGYSFAAIGPILIGFIYDFTHAWTIPLIVMIAATILLIIFGLSVGRDRYVFD